MAVKTANVTARIQPNIKEQAEEILERLGIPVSVFIDMAYRQVIMRGGVPFSLDIPDTLATRDSLTKAEFDTMMQTGFIQDDSVSVEEAFEQLKAEIQYEGIRSKNYQTGVRTDGSNKVQVIAIIYGKRDQMKRLANMDMQ